MMSSSGRNCRDDRNDRNDRSNQRVMREVRRTRGMTLILWLSLLSFAQTTQGASSKIITQPSLVATIAGGEVSRIGLRSGELLEVIGDESKYELYWSGDNRNLFIKPKVEVGENLSISLIFADGWVQDLRLTVGDMTTQTLLLEPNRWIRGTRHIRHLEINEMLKAMNQGIKGKYYVTQQRRTIAKNQQWVITQQQSYAYDKLRGAVLSVKNLTDQLVKLQEQDFNNLFEGTVAMSLTSQWLEPRGKAQILIITRETDEK